MEEKGSGNFFVTLLILALILAVVLPVVLPYEYVTEKPPMNASIVQYFSIELSGNLSQGIFFTNGSTIGTQYPITNVSTWNNATGNYLGESYGTVYNVTAVSNTVPIKVCQCACDNLLCNNASECGTSLIYINGNDGGCANKGVGWANASTPTSVPDSWDKIFASPDNFQVINSSIPSGGNVYLRYWLNPCPNSIPSGTYNTTYMFKAVDYTYDCGTCSC